MRVALKIFFLGIALILVCGLDVRTAEAQSFGVDLRNTLMPASGGMAGASIASPQDLISGINANPATLTQFEGTQFIIGGAWAEATFNLTQTGNIGLPADPLIRPFSAKSKTPGSAVPNIGVTQEIDAGGVPLSRLGTTGRLDEHQHRKLLDRPGLHLAVRP